MTDSLSPPGQGPRSVAQRPELARFGMIVLLITLGVLFAFSLLVFGIMRLRHGPWLPSGATLPFGLWVSTLIILISSGTMQWALVSGQKGNWGGLKLGAAVTLALGLGFLLSQYVVWRELAQLGFKGRGSLVLFYFVTVLHGAHVLGGLVALLRLNYKAFAGQPQQAYPTAWLTTVYWHFLDVVWLFLMMAIVLSAQ